MSYNTLEMLFLSLLTVHQLLVLAGNLPLRHVSVLSKVNLGLFLFPTYFLLFCCLCKQCLSKEGGFGRLRNVSLRVWWRGRYGDNDNTHLSPSVLENMMNGIREPLLIDQIREDQVTGL